MSRPKKCRRVCEEPQYNSFAPKCRKRAEQVVMNVDEYEVIRLLDYEKMTQEECAAQIGIARTSVTEIYEKARYKMADCIVHGKMLVISGGNYKVCDGTFAGCMGTCRQGNSVQAGVTAREKGENEMRIAVTYENGEIFQHFGHTEQFKFYDFKEGKLVKEQVVGTSGQGHGALAGFLAEQKVDALICGGIGGGARQALAEAGIRLYGGVQGDAEQAAKAFAAGNLRFDPDVQCSHHEEGHTCGAHSCGSNGTGAHEGCAGNGDDTKACGGNRS